MHLIIKVKVSTEYPCGLLPAFSSQLSLSLIKVCIEYIENDRKQFNHFNNRECKKNARVLSVGTVLIVYNVVMYY